MTEKFVKSNYDFYIEEEDWKQFKRAFNLIDEDKSGKLNMAEMDQLIRRFSGGIDQEPSDEEVREIILSFDGDGTGYVTFDEFLRIMAKRSELEKVREKTEEFKDAFQVFDKNGDGFISSDELTE
ncbi:calmodulin-3, partial [Eurytemora carolleeae]|uniref:calmodulin-3 n=1 Tax=Eurytemora carolleeae TaxID=1294199 RepID=UPI000C762250